MKLKYILIILGSALFAACDIDTKPESGFITSDQNQEIIAALPGRLSASVNGMYASIGKQYCVYPSVPGRDDDFGYPMVCLSQDLNGPDMVSDNSDYNWFSLSSQYADRSDVYANPYMRWAVLYNQLKMANDILEPIPEETDNKTLIYYSAQAKAVRAFDFLSLAPYFQFKYKGNEDKPSVPILTDRMETPYDNNPRASLRDLYKLIIDDLTYAIDSLAGFERTSLAQVDRSVAYGLRARANLYMENWAEAAADATEAMKGYTFSTKADISKPAFISADEPGWMWAIIILPANISGGYPSWPAWFSSFTANGYTTGVGCYKQINTLLYNKIPGTDVRKGWWVDADLKSPNLASCVWVTEDGNVTGNDIATLTIDGVKEAFKPYTNVKFGQFGGIGNDVNAGDWCLMRVEEMLLIQAEATAMAGNLPLGKQILEDWVKTYRDPNYTSKAADLPSFQNEVWLQRRIELWGEGFSMSDIMRLGKNVVRFNNRDAGIHPEAFKFNVASTDGYLLLRLPQAETNANQAIPPSLNNNEGTQPQPGDGAGLTDGVTD